MTETIIGSQYLWVLNILLKHGTFVIFTWKGLIIILPLLFTAHCIYLIITI